MTRELQMPAAFGGEFIGGVSETLRLSADGPGHDFIVGQNTCAAAAVAPVDQRSNPAQPSAPAPVSGPTTSASVGRVPVAEKPDASASPGARAFAVEMKKRVLARLADEVAAVRAGIAAVREVRSDLWWCSNPDLLAKRSREILESTDDFAVVREMLADLAAASVIKSDPILQRSLAAMKRRHVSSQVILELIPAVSKLRVGIDRELSAEEAIVRVHKSRLVKMFGGLLGISQASSTEAEIAGRMIRNEFAALQDEIQRILSIRSGPSLEDVTQRICGPLEVFLRE